MFIKHTKRYPIEIREYLEERDYNHIIESCKKEQWEKFYTSKKDILLLCNGMRKVPE